MIRKSRTRNLLAATLAWLGLAAGAQAAPAMWLAQDADTRIWFLGSIHILPPDVQWRTPALEKVLADADRVYFEVPLAFEDQQRVAELSFRLGLMESGKRLLDLLTADERAAVERAATLAGVPMTGLNIWKPWVATSMIMSGFTARQGYAFGAGVDMTLQTEIPRDRQRYFETVDEQLHFLADGTEQQQVAMLVDTARELERTPGTIDDMLAAWTDGDAERLRASLDASLELSDPAMTDTLLRNRNERWVEDIAAMLDEPGNILVVVGAAHLVGEDNVPSLLEARGIKVERVQ